MGRRQLLDALLLAGWLTAAGCGHVTPRAGRCTTQPPAAEQTWDELPLTEPGAVAVVVEPPAPPTPFPAVQYRKLTAAVCGRLAARNSGVARVLEREPPAARGDGCTCTGGLALRLAADEARNRAIADALDLYYKLAGAEAGAALYRAAEADAAATLNDLRAAAEAGLKERADPGEVELQRADARAEADRLDGSARELDAGLKAALGLPADPGVRLRPGDPLRVDADAVDPDEAVRVGLAARPDLNLLRSLAADDPAARRVLSGLNPLLAGPVPELPCGLRVLIRVAAPLAGRWPPEPDPAATAGQLRELLAERERQAEAEIRAAAERVRTKAAAARLYADTADRLKARAAEVEQQSAAGRSAAGELAKAKANVRRADGETLRAAADHAAARVKLRQAQGLLVRDVGGGR